MSKYHQVVTDGKTFRITSRTVDDGTYSYRDETIFILDHLKKPMEFYSKEAAQRYIHDNLSMNGWEKA